MLPPSVPPKNVVTALPTIDLPQLNHHLHIQNRDGWELISCHMVVGQPGLPNTTYMWWRSTV
jgi:hypothetical protein